MIESSIRSLEERLADERSAPGGGTAAAVAAAMAAALTAKAARRSAGSWAEAPGIAAQARSLADRCLGLAESDSEAFDAALRALAEGKEVEARLERTAVVLAELAEAATDVAELAATAAERCDGTFRADAVSAALLAEAAVRCAATLLARNLTVGEGSERLKRARRLTDTAATASRHALETEP